MKTELVSLIFYIYKKNIVISLKLSILGYKAKSYNVYKFIVIVSKAKTLKVRKEKINDLLKGCLLS